MARRRITRETDLSNIESVNEALIKTFGAIDKGFQDQHERADDNMDNWDCFNCRLGAKQFYAGESRGYLPLVRDAVRARRTRFVNQIFPQAGRYVEVTSEDGETPHALMALAEYYVERAELRTKVAPALCVAGDVEGQMTLLVTWGKRIRHTVSRETSPIKISGIEYPDLGEEETIKEGETEDFGTDAEVIPDSDFLVLPVTSNCLADALASGGSVTIVRRWSKDKIDEMEERGEITETAAEHLKEEMGNTSPPSRANLPKKLSEIAGIRSTGSGQFAVVYRTWTMVKLPKMGRRLVLAYYGGDLNVLGCRLCPYWSDEIDVITMPVEKLPGIIKGQSLVKPVADLQYHANDTFNAGMDSATRTQNPIVMTDPEKNPKTSSMVLDMGVVWETSPKDTSIVSFPPLYQHSMEIISALKSQIYESLSVNPSMIVTQAAGKTKPSQAQVAQQQQVDLLTTADAVISQEGGVWTPFIDKCMKYDAQFRDVEITIKSFGELGVKAEMVKVPPQQAGKRWRFRWFGVEQVRAAQQIQNRIAATNVLIPLFNHPSVAQSGWRGNLVPIIRDIVETTWNARLAGEIFVNVKDELSIPPELENEMMMQGLEAHISPTDDDMKHLQAHMMMMTAYDPLSPAGHQFARHIAEHMSQIKLRQAAQAQAQGLGQPSPGGGQRSGGSQGRPGPRAGAQPQMPRGGQMPPGAIHRDRMPAGGGQVVPMPRKM